VPCCMDWGREAIWGNVREQSIEQIWHGEKRRVFQEMIHSGEELPPEFICCRCEDAVPATEPIKEAERPAEHEVEQAEVTASAPPEKLEAVVSDSEKRVGDLESRLKGLLERQKAFLSERKQ